MIRLLNSSAETAAAMTAIGTDIRRIFGQEVKTEELRLEFLQALDQSRKQYSSGILLSQVLAHANDEYEKRIAVVDVDLFVPVLTFVFGEAQFQGPAAIVSLHRLGNEFYGLRKDDGLMQSRLTKEIVHELGHTFGLTHCRQFECVMRSSTYVEEIDLKRDDFCERCRAQLFKTSTNSILNQPEHRT